jgi:hypothetical protein
MRGPEASSGAAEDRRVFSEVMYRERRIERERSFRAIRTIGDVRASASEVRYGV